LPRQKLPTAARDGLLSKPEELVGRLVIRKATAEVIVSCLAVAIRTAQTALPCPAEAVGIALVGIEYSNPRKTHHMVAAVVQIGKLIRTEYLASKIVAP